MLVVIAFLLIRVAFQLDRFACFLLVQTNTLISPPRYSKLLYLFALNFCGSRFVSMSTFPFVTIDHSLYVRTCVFSRRLLERHPHRASAGEAECAGMRVRYARMQLLERHPHRASAVEAAYAGMRVRYARMRGRHALGVRGGASDAEKHAYAGMRVRMRQPHAVYVCGKGACGNA